MTPQEKLAHWLRHTCRINPLDLRQRIERDLGKKSLVTYLRANGADHPQLAEAVANTIAAAAVPEVEQNVDG
jgi:hypothetical protein